MHLSLPMNPLSKILVWLLSVPIIFYRTCIQKAVGLAHAAAHQHTLHGMAQALFRYGYEECHLRVGRTPGIAPGNYAQWIGKGRKLGSAGAKELSHVQPVCS